MRRRPAVLLVGLCVMLAVAAGVAVAQEGQYIRGEPNLDVYVPDPTLTVGTSDELRLQIANDGDVRAGAVTQRGTVTTARAVTVDVDDGNVPFDVTTQRQSVGSVPDGEAVDAPVSVTVPDDAEPGEYSLPVRVRYSHTFQYAPNSNVVQERTRTVRKSIDVTVEERPRFALTTVESDVQVGDSGTLVTNVTNVGSEPARDLRVRLESESGDVTFGDASANTARVDRLDPGENATVSFRTSVREDVDLREVALEGSVRFADSDGIEHTQEGIATGFAPTDEQSFSVSVERSTLRVGELGVVEGTVRNDGPADVDDVVLALGDARLDPRSETYAVGSLDAGESASFRFRGTVPADADAVPQRIDVTTRYRAVAGIDRGTIDRTAIDRTTVDPIRVDVAERRDAVEVTAADPAFAAGESGTLELDVRNRRDVDIRDVRLTLAVDDPLESEFRTTIVPELAPDETDSVAFDLEVDGDAPASRYPATVAVEYTDPDDETATARSATVAVEVIETDDDVLPAVEILIFGLVALLVGAVFVWLYRR